MKQQRILFFIVIAQFMCTSVWFAVNAIMPELTIAYEIPKDSVGFFTSVIQFGFIIGTLIFAIWSISDRFLATKVFMYCAIISACSNIGLLLSFNTFYSITLFRFVTGVCLAGIYPVGIKLAADHFKNGLGRALGLLVGTLVLGTSIPHFFNYIALKNSLFVVIGLTSALSIIGALLVGFLVPNGEYSKTGAKFQPKVMFQMFRSKGFRKASFGYFGHMWELYTFWAFVPFFIGLYNSVNHTNLNISLWTFIIIGIGFVSCVWGGLLTAKYSSQLVAKGSLLGSLICCLLFPIVVQAPSFLFISFMLLWGMFVISDSPQLSTLVAQSAPVTYKGTAITLVNCIGFSITIVSIQVLSYLQLHYSETYIYWILAIGPMLGLFFLNLKHKPKKIEY
ncbi:MFS transporter [Aquimarina agarilytica]|uniref:MFS transporter n=1 Tax=Aquimarina agarilytica TaxID=1087449 RepID=UPI000288D1E5|nr:MFS transporter [Aquimarina agarilytica]